MVDPCDDVGEGGTTTENSARVPGCWLARACRLLLLLLLRYREVPSSVASSDLRPPGARALRSRIANSYFVALQPYMALYSKILCLRNQPLETQRWIWTARDR
eukprot:1952737-Prymnesium_polylepis.1